MDDIKKPKSKRLHSHDVKAFSSDECNTLMEALSKDCIEVKRKNGKIEKVRVEFLMWRTIATIMRYTGIRPGECFALKWQDFDYERKIAKIRRALSMDGEVNLEQIICEYTEPEYKILKNENPSSRSEITPYRDLRINDEIVNVVKEWRGYVNTHLEKGRALEEIRRANGTEEFLFSVLTKGTTPTPDYCCQEYRKVLIKSGLNTHRYRLYRFRHTFCTEALRALGFDTKKVQILMGDRDPSMVTQVYNSIRHEELMEESADKLLTHLENYTKPKEQKAAS